MTLLSDPVLRVLADFRKNDEGRLEGVVKTLLPNTRYQFQVYALNSMNYNQPSDYSYPIRTPTLESSGEFSFSASVSEGKTTNILYSSKCALLAASTPHTKTRRCSSRPTGSTFQPLLTLC